MKTRHLSQLILHCRVHGGCIRLTDPERTLGLAAPARYGHQATRTGADDLGRGKEAWWRGWADYGV